LSTEALYYNDNKQNEFEACVTGLAQDGKVVTLDKTLFYPEGGGQPADHGTLNGIKVIDVKKSGHDIKHFLSEPLPEDTLNVKGCLDWKRRFDFMQQHSGQHLLSGCLFRKLALETVSVHLGESYSSIEVADANLLSPEDQVLIEDQVNKLICENRIIKSYSVDEADISSFDLRRPPMVKGMIRLVEMEGADLVACGGVHCRCTSEIRLIKITGQELIRGNLRIFFKIGDRAWEDFRRKHGFCRRIAEDLSVPVESLSEKWKLQKQEIQDLKMQVSDLKIREAVSLARSLEDGSGCITYHWQEGSPEIMKLVGKELLSSDSVFCLTILNKGKLQWVVGCGGNRTFRFNEHRQILLSAIEGKGGGSHPLWQGMGMNAPGLNEFQRIFKELC